MYTYCYTVICTCASGGLAMMFESPESDPVFGSPFPDPPLGDGECFAGLPCLLEGDKQSISQNKHTYNKQISLSVYIYIYIYTYKTGIHNIHTT